jgi:hypothetical protein
MAVASAMTLPFTCTARCPRPFPRWPWTEVHIHHRPGPGPLRSRLVLHLAAGPKTCCPAYPSALAQSGSRPSPPPRARRPAVSAMSPCTGREARLARVQRLRRSACPAAPLTVLVSTPTSRPSRLVPDRSPLLTSTAAQRDLRATFTFRQGPGLTPHDVLPASPSGVRRSFRPRRPASRPLPRQSAFATPRCAAVPSGDTHLPVRPAPRRSAQPASPSGVRRSCDLAGPPRGRFRAETRSQPRGEPPHLRATPTFRLGSPRAEALGPPHLPVHASRPTPSALPVVPHVPEHARHPASSCRSLGRHPPLGPARPAPKRVACLASWCAPIFQPHRPSS